MSERLAAWRYAFDCHSPTRIVAIASRERATIDLRGLGPALKAHALGRNLKVSDVVRLAVAAVLETSVAESSSHAIGDAEATPDGTVKLTIRLRTGVAARLTAQARVAGLSRGAYVTTLLDKAPAPPLALARILGTSTEQLAVVASDLNELIRTMRRDDTLPAGLLEDRVRPLVGEVRQHVGLASRLMSELRPARMLATQPRGHRAGDQDART